MVQDDSLAVKAPPRHDDLTDAPALLSDVSDMEVLEDPPPKRTKASTAVQKFSSRRPSRAAKSEAATKILLQGEDAMVDAASDKTEESSVPSENQELQEDEEQDEPLMSYLEGTEKEEELPIKEEEEKEEPSKEDTKSAKKSRRNVGTKSARRNTPKKCKVEASHKEDEDVTEESGKKEEEEEEPLASLACVSSKKPKVESEKPVASGDKKKKKRKLAAAKAETKTSDKTKASDKKAEGGEKAAKRPRVKPDVVEHAAKEMLKRLIEDYKADIKEVPLDVLAKSIKNKKGKAYTNHRSDAIAESVKLLKSRNQAEKISTADKIGAMKLLQAEIDKIPKEEICKDPAKHMEKLFGQFLDRLKSQPKGGSGKPIIDAAEAIWGKLSDGKDHTRKELVAVTTYKATNSSGFEAIMAVLQKMKIVETKVKGKVRFTAKVFPHGRPK